MSSTRAATLRTWLMATRPKTLPAALIPVLVGVAGSSTLGTVKVLPSLAAMLGALLLQVGSNFANDVYDHEKGADTDERVGPTRAVHAGLVSAIRMKQAMWLTFALSLLVGAYLFSVAGLPIVIIGITSIVAAIAYTGGPYPLGYHGLGDAFVMLFFGFVAVGGTVFINLGYTPLLTWLCAVPVGSLATAILVVNNVRDVNTDEKAGKRTLAVRWGRAAGVLEYRLLLLLAFGTPPAAILMGELSAPALLPLLALPFGFKLQKELQQQRGAQLNQTLANTAKLLLLYGVLFSIGITTSNFG